MHFESRARYEGTLDEVQRSLLDARYLDFVLAHHGVLLEAKLLETRAEPGRVWRRVRYRPRPVIARVGPEPVPAEWFAFVEESTFDTARHQLTFRNRPTTPSIADLLINTGTLTLREVAGRCERLMEGEITVKLPFLLKPLALIAEQLIHREGLEILDGEVPVTNRFLVEVLRK